MHASLGCVANVLPFYGGMRMRALGGRRAHTPHECAGNTDDDGRQAFTARYCFAGNFPIYATVQYKPSSPTAVAQVESVRRQ